MNTTLAPLASRGHALDLSPEAFVDEIARIFPDLKEVAIGEGWSFGRNRAGNATHLAELAKAHGFMVKAIAPVMLDGAPVSSTRIREAILQRRFDEAARLRPNDQPSPMATCLRSGKIRAISSTKASGERFRNASSNLTAMTATVPCARM